MSQPLELSDVIHDPSTPDAQAHPSKHLENPDHPRSSSTWAPITGEAESRPPLAPSGTSDNNTNNNSNTSSSKPSPPRPSLRSARANSSIILRSPVLGPRSASAHPPIINNHLDEIRQSRVGPTRTNGRTHRRVASDQSSSYPHYDSSVRRPYSDTASRPQTPSQGGGFPYSHSHHHPHHHPVRSHSFHHHDRHAILPFRHPSTPLVSGSIGIGGSTSAAAPTGAVASPTYSTYSNYSLFNTQPSSRSPSGSDPRSASPATSVSSDQSSSAMHTAPNSAVLLPDRIDSPSGRRPPHRYEAPGGGGSGSGVSTLQFPTTATASSYGRPGSPYDNGAVPGSINGSGAGRQKNRKQRLTNAHRKQICIFHNDNPTMRQEDIAAHFNVERSTISKILKSAEKWLSVPEGDDDKVAKHRPSKFPVIEQRLVKWLESMYEQGGMPTLGDALIRTHAREEAKAMSCSEDKFKASSGWVENFKHRHCIRKGVWHRDEYYATAAAAIPSTGLSSLSSSTSHQLLPPLSKLNPAYEPSTRLPYVGSPLAMSAASTTMMSHVPPSPSPMSSVAGPSRHHFMTTPVVQSPNEEEGMGMNVDHEMVDGTTGPYSRYSAAATGGAEAGSAALPRLSSVPHSPSRILAPLSLMQHHHHHQQQPYGSYDAHEHHHHHHHHQGHSTSYDYQQHKLPPLNAAVAEQGDPSPSSSSSSSSAAAAAASVTRPLKLLDRRDGGETSTTVLPPMYGRPDDQGAHAYRSHHHLTAADPSSLSSTASSSGVPRYEQQHQQEQEHSPNEEHHPNSAHLHEQEQQREQEPFPTTEDFSARARREFPPPPINDARPHIPEVEYAINTLLEFVDREGEKLHGLDQKDVAALGRIKKVLFEYAGGI